jgi:hypothetical protein
MTSFFRPRRDFRIGLDLLLPEKRGGRLGPGCPGVESRRSGVCLGRMYGRWLDLVGPDYPYPSESFSTNSIRDLRLESTPNETCLISAFTPLVICRLTEKEMEAVNPVNKQAYIETQSTRLLSTSWFNTVRILALKLCLPCGRSCDVSISGLGEDGLVSFGVPGRGFVVGRTFVVIFPFL